MALHILRRAYERGVLRPGAPDRRGDQRQHRASRSPRSAARWATRSRIFMPDWMSRERHRPHPQPRGDDPCSSARDEGGFLGSIRAAPRSGGGGRPAASCRGSSRTRTTCEAHATTTGPGDLVAAAVPPASSPDAFVAGVGTGGTIMGVGRFLQRASRRCRLHPLEPANSPTLSTGHKVGKHRIQGISDEFIPPIVDLGAARPPSSASTTATRSSWRRSSPRELGLGVGHLLRRQLPRRPAGAGRAGRPRRWW
ncbi:MAG: hypothetical protein MZV70_18345 [Desulfobacterales bacterium]|nr:hypothetical protein [Desulfobacterales bacterium]